MQKKLTITVDEDVYEGLHKKIGRCKISKFVEELVRPHVVKPEMETATDAYPVRLLTNTLHRMRRGEGVSWVDAEISVD